MPLRENSDKQQDYLRELSWQFEGDLFEDPAKFEKSVREYQLECENEDNWRPLELLFPDTHIRICFPVFSSGKDIELEVELWSTGPQGFTNLDIMFQLHNNVTALLRHHHDDHIFFEGIFTNPAWQEAGCWRRFKSATIEVARS
jgi:hypothetical protein